MATCTCCAELQDDVESYEAKSAGLFIQVFYQLKLTVKIL